MSLTTVDELRHLVGKRLYWEDRGSRYIFPRSGVLTSIYRGTIEFDESGDYKRPKDFTNLTETPHEGWMI